MFSKRIPFLGQMEATECGAACLGMVLRHFGHHAELLEVRGACGVSRDGTSAAAILRAAKAYGLQGRAVRVELAALSTGPRPAILHWDFNHFVVLNGTRRHGIEVLDPAFGPRFVPWSEADRLFTGVRLSFTPGATFKKRADRSASTRKYLKVLLAALPNLALLAISALTLEVLGLLFPILAQVAIDFVVRPRQTRFLITLAVLLLLALLLHGALSLARQRIAAGLRVSLDWSLRSDFVAHLVQLPLAFFAQRGSGDLSGRTAGHDEIRDVLSGLSTAGLDACLVVSYLALMFSYDARLALVVTSLTLLRVLLVIMMQARVRYPSASEVVAAANEGSAIDETFANIESIQALGIQDSTSRRYLDLLTQRLNATGERRRVEQNFLFFTPLLDSLTLAGIYWFGGLRVANDQMTLGVLAAFVAMASLFVRPLAALVDAVTRIPRLQATLRRIDDVWAATPDDFGMLDPGPLSCAMRLEHVSFAHSDGASLAVDDVTLEIAPGERIAIVGASGSGKSSLAWVLAGLARPSSGAVYWDGRDLSSLDRACVRKHVAIVFPDAMHFSGSVRDNLEAGESIALGELEAAAQLACIHDELTALPDGYSTRLDAGGGPLSGGQRQRLALARALLARPRVLILDEATSSVELELESAILAQLRPLGLTQIIISHRPSALHGVDRIVVMDAGKVVDQGSYEKLSLRCATFQRVIQAQTEVVV